jgi:hypothetical protein
MKIRNGFVSNSSTSSFVLAGWKGRPSVEALKILAKHGNYENDLTDESENHEWTDVDYEILESADFTMYSEENLWGADLCYISDYGIDELDFKEMQEKLKMVEELAEKLGLEPPRVFGGVCAS